MKTVAKLMRMEDIPSPGRPDPGGPGTDRGAEGEVILDASMATNPDGVAWRFAWSIDPVQLVDSTAIQRPTWKIGRLKIPKDAAGRLIPVLLTVKDGGIPSLSTV